MPARRVTFVTHTAELGGAETALLRLAMALEPAAFLPHVVVMADGPLVARLRDAGIGVTVVAGGAVTSVTRKEASGLLRAPRMARETRVASRALADAVESAGSDLIVAHSLKAAVMVALAARRVGKPWVWHLNDRLASDYLPLPAALGMRALAGRGPRIVVANSFATLSTLGRRGRKRAVVAYPGLPLAAYQAARPTEGPTTVGLIGRISETKGQLEFVAAAAQLTATRPDLRFRIVGSALFADGEYEDRVRKAVSALPQGLVTLTGWVDDPGAELRGLWVLVHASPVPEPFGQVVIEGMAAGVPVVAARAGGVIEILDPDGAAKPVADGVWTTPRGLLVTPGDPAAIARAISFVLDDQEATRERTQAASHAAREHFTIDVTAAVVEQAWRRALGEAV